MRILITNAYTPANLGDGAILQAMIGEAKRVFGDDVEVDVSASDPSAFADMLGVDAIGRLVPWHPLGTSAARLRWLFRSLPMLALLFFGTAGGRKRLGWLVGNPYVPVEARGFVRAVLSADLILAAGGGYLSDHYWKQFPIWHLEYRCARAAGCPLVFFSQSFGPAQLPVSRFFLRRSVAASSLFIARDEPSRRHLRTLGVAEDKVAVAPDVALLLADGLPAISPPSSPAVVGLSLLKWANYSGDREQQHDAYLGAVERSVSRLLEDSREVRLQIFSTNAATGVNTMDDVAVATEMAGRLTSTFEHRLDVVPWTPEPLLFASRVAHCQLFLASRMHSAVLALSTGVPVVGIAYEEKLRGLLEMFGLDKYVVDIEDLDGLDTLLAEAWQKREELKELVLSRLPNVRMRASEAMMLCDRVLRP